MLYLDKEEQGWAINYLLYHWQRSVHEISNAHSQWKQCAEVVWIPHGDKQHCLIWLTTEKGALYASELLCNDNWSWDVSQMTDGRDLASKIFLDIKVVYKMVREPWHHMWRLLGYGELYNADAHWESGNVQKAQAQMFVHSRQAGLDVGLHGFFSFNDTSRAQLHRNRFKVNKSVCKAMSHHSFGKWDGASGSQKFWRVY